LPLPIRTAHTHTHIRTYIPIGISLVIIMRKTFPRKQIGNNESTGDCYLKNGLKLIACPARA